VFGKGSGRILSEKYGIPLLAEIPLDPRISEANDEGRPYVLAYPETPVTKSFEEMARKIAEILKTPEGRSEEETG
jgi:ATP-binding protein involved in chromosome partitioning